MAIIGWRTTPPLPNSTTARAPAIPRTPFTRAYASRISGQSFSLKSGTWYGAATITIRGLPWMMYSFCTRQGYTVATCRRIRKATPWRRHCCWARLKLFRVPCRIIKQMPSYAARTWTATTTGFTCKPI
jgi:hypothetical protein